MSALSEAKAKLYARKAAALGMSMEQFLAHIEDEQRKLDAINRACTNRVHQWAVITANAACFNRTFTKLT